MLTFMFPSLTSDIVSKAVLLWSRLHPWDARRACPSMSAFSGLSSFSAHANRESHHLHIHSWPSSVAQAWLSWGQLAVSPGCWSIEKIRTFHWDKLINYSFICFPQEWSPIFIQTFFFYQGHMETMSDLPFMQKWQNKYFCMHQGRDGQWARVLPALCWSPTKVHPPSFPALIDTWVGGPLAHKPPYIGLSSDQHQQKIGGGEWKVIQFSLWFWH